MNKKMRMTKKRSEILNVLKQNRKHLTCEDIYFILREKNINVGLATVYRTVDVLHSMGIINRINIGDGTARYEYVDVKKAKHHHHLICIECGNIIEYSDEQEAEYLKGLQERIEHQYKFKTLSHDIYLYGLCEKCRKKLEEKQDK